MCNTPRVNSTVNIQTNTIVGVPEEIELGNHFKTAKMPITYIRGVPTTTAMFDEASMEKQYNMQVRDDDLFVVGLPRSGTTWTSNVLICLRYGNDVGRKCAADISQLIATIPYLEVDYDNERQKKILKGFKMPPLERFESPRLMLSHLPKHAICQDMFSSKGKIILVVRNTKDNLLSRNAFAQSNPNLRELYPGSFEKFAEEYFDGKINYGNYWDWNSEWLKYSLESPENVFVLHFEDLLSSFVDTMMKVSAFVGIDKTAEEIQEIKDLCDAGKIKGPSVKTTGDANTGRSKGRDLLTPELIERIDTRTKEVFKGSPYLDKLLE